MSSRRGCASRRQNSSVVPTASPIARPRKAPSARSRMPAAVRDGTDGARIEHCATCASCAAVSMACRDCASRTRLIASSGDAPSSTNRRAATVPARPRPPRQWTSTSKPSLSRSRMGSPALVHSSSKSRPGGHPSGIGACSHSMCLSRTASGRSRTDRPSNSSSVIRLTTAVAPQCAIASRSASRFRAWGLDIPSGPVLPGHNVMPMRPWHSPGVTEAIRSGLGALVLAAGMNSLPSQTRVAQAITLTGGACANHSGRSASTTAARRSSRSSRPGPA